MRVRLRLLQPDQVTGIRNRFETRVWNPITEDLAVRRRHEAVARSPQDQRRRGDAREALLEAVLGNREEELGGRSEAAHEADQQLDLLLGPVVLVADQAGKSEHLLGGGTRLIVEEIRDQLVGHVAEEVDDGRLVAPQADRGGERETADLLRAQGRDLGRQPAAHRLAHDIRPLDLERLQDVEDVQEEIPLVVEQLEPGRAAEAGKQRRIHSIAPRQHRQGAIPRRHAAGTVQEEEWRSRTRLEHLDRRASGPELEDPGRRLVAHAAASARPEPLVNCPGFVRSLAGSGFGQTTSSWSENIGRRCGMTLVANSSVLRFTSATGAEPMCSPSARCPTRNERASSSSCWRTVSGEPATM